MTSNTDGTSVAPENPTPTSDKKRAAPDTSKNGDVSRRALLTGSAIGAGVGLALGAGGATTVAAIRANNLTAGYAEPTVEPSLGYEGDEPGYGGESLPCHGAHQAGITTLPAAHARYLAFTLKPETDRDAIMRMLRILTDDIEGLVSGAGPLADPEPELAARPSRLTITVGVGSELVKRVDSAKVPAWLAPLPAFKLDELTPEYSGGDLLIVLQADSQMPISHAARMMHRDLASFATPTWFQQGFRQSRGAEAPGKTMRNLMGQVDGTVNPSPEEDDFSELVWIDGTEKGEGWLKGGSALVFRRIRMELDTWDQVDRPGREDTIGRTLDTGAPITGGDESTPMDFEAKNALGLPAIPITAHSRRAHSTDPSERIYRRAINYDEGTEAGLVFVCYQRDPRKQFVPIQERLDELDMLNEWVTHTGSAVFAMLPGFKSGDIIGASLFN